MGCPLVLSGSALTGFTTNDDCSSIILLCTLNNFPGCINQPGVFLFVVTIVFVVSICMLQSLPFYPSFPFLLLLGSGHLHLNPDLLCVVCSPLFYFRHAVFNFFLQSLNNCWYNWQLKSAVEVDYPVVGLATDFMAPRHIALAESTVC